MENDIFSLEEMIRLLCQGTQIHVCIYDIAGVLGMKELQLPSAFRVHATRFCDLAKSSTLGNSLCMRCKARANKAAIRKQSLFSGYCPYGLYEIAKPVIVDGEAVCIIYLGNLMPDREEAVCRVQNACSITGADAPSLIQELGHAQPVLNLGSYERIALALDSYIRLLLNHTDWAKQKKADPGCRRKAREVADYITVNFSQDLSLKQLADLYFVNEKYLGKVFQAEMGETMRQYLNRIRLSNAARLLRNSELSVLNIAMDCGFQNIPYFNRMFMGRYQMTPLQYRRKFSALSEEEAVAAEGRRGTPGI